MITGRGIGFLVAAIVLFLLARLTQVGWLYLVDSVMWGITVLAAVIPWLSVAFVTAHRTVDGPTSTRSSPGPAEGDPLEITLILGARAFWPSYVLNLFYNCPVATPDNRYHRFFVFKVSRSNPVSMVTTVEAYQRGMHELGPVIAESTAPFGLFRRRRNLTASQEVLVYPQVHALRRLAMAEGLQGMESYARKSPAGTEPAGSRRFIPGDPQRLIHWPNTARTGQLMVKELEEPADPTTYLVFDATRVWGEGRESTLEYGIKIVASVADYAHRNQLPVRVLGGDIGSVSASQTQPMPLHFQGSWPVLLKRLALIAPGDGSRLRDSLSTLPPSASALIILSHGDRPTLQAIAALSSSLHRLVVVSLEGFGGPQLDEADLSPLRAAKVPVVPCRPGKLREALNILETMDGPLPSTPSGSHAARTTSGWNQGRNISAASARYANGFSDG